MSNKIFKEVLQLEAKALMVASEKMDSFNTALLGQIFLGLKTTGANLVFCGVGKSGLIAQKLASTFCSLGLPSHFLHPVEAMHGDMGRLTEADAIVFISNSGTTEEILKLMKFLNFKKERMVALVGDVNSPIAKQCETVFDCSVEKEACINNLAPTTSSTLALAMGDAMAVFFESITDLTKESFALNHPGGLLGKSLHCKVKDLMWEKFDCPMAKIDETMREVLLKMTVKNVGGLAVVDQHGQLLGIIVEGDIRRTFSDENKGLDTPVGEVMNTSPLKINANALAYEALELMENRKNAIDLLPVVEDNIFLGFLRLHDLLKEGFKRR